MQGDAPMVRLLLDGGCDVSLVDEYNCSYLLCAAKFGHGDIVDILLGTGKLDVNRQDTSGNTALLYASANNYLVIAQLLLSHGCDPGISDECGKTALMIAAGNGYSQMVRLLLSTHNSCPERVDWHGLTAAQIAKRAAYTMLSKYIVRQRILDVLHRNRILQRTVVCRWLGLVDFGRPGSNCFFFKLGQVCGVSASMADISVDIEATPENHFFYCLGVRERI
jgi:ankyrin repeat protein